MSKSTLQLEILKLLIKSSVDSHDKEMIQILLPIMSLVDLKALHETLKSEQGSLRQLDQKQKRIEMKYRVMLEKSSNKAG
jgi:cell division protein ZapA (FtsZ GTPase activity inhibitor)